MTEGKDTRVALIGIIIEDTDAAGELNGLLHQYNDSIIGRMGVPHREKGVSVISIVIDAPQDDINALSGKLGAVKGVSTKTVYSQA